MKKQSHLLCAKELKKRGITRYDAEIILSQGITLPSPKVILDRKLPSVDRGRTAPSNTDVSSSSNTGVTSPLDTGVNSPLNTGVYSPLNTGVNSHLSNVERRQRHSVRDCDGRFKSSRDREQIESCRGTYSKTMDNAIQYRRSPRFKSKIHTAHLEKDPNIGSSCLDSVANSEACSRVNLTEIFNGIAKTLGDMPNGAIVDKMEVKMEEGLDSTHTFPRKKLLRKYLATKTSQDDSTSLADVFLSDENVETDEINLTVNSQYEYNLKGRRRVNSDSTKSYTKEQCQSVRHSPRLQHKIFAKGSPQEEPSNYTDSDFSLTLGNVRIASALDSSRKRYLSCPESQPSLMVCLNVDGMPDINCDYNNSGQLHKYVGPKSPLTIDCSSSKSLQTVRHSPRLRGSDSKIKSADQHEYMHCSHQGLQEMSRGCIHNGFTGLQSKERVTDVEYLGDSSEKNNSEMESKGYQTIFEKFCLFQDNSHLHNTTDNLNSVVCRKGMSDDLSSYRQSAHRASPRRRLHSPQDTDGIIQEDNGNISETSCCISKQDCYSHDSLVADEDTYHNPGGVDIKTLESTSVMNISDHLTDTLHHIPMGNTDLLLSLTKSGCNSNVEYSSKTSINKESKKNKNRHGRVKKKRAHYSVCAPEKKIPRLTIKMRRDPILEKELEKQKSDGVIFKLEDKPECSEETDVEASPTDSGSIAPAPSAFNTSRFYSTNNVPKKLRLKFGNSSIDILDIHIPPLNNTLYTNQL